jgi:hypothetical protein
MFIPPSMTLLWILPALQCLLLVFFCLNAVWQFWCVGREGGREGGKERENTSRERESE